MKIRRYDFFVALALVWASTGLGQVTNSLPGRSLVKLVPDYLRPRVYALNKGNGTTPGTLLALNSTNGSVMNEINVGVGPTDMVMTPPGDALYVINGGSRTISKIDLATFAVAADKAIATPNTYNPTLPLYLAVGRSNLVYFTDGAWAPSITAFDYLQGTNVAGYDDGNGVGGLLATRDGKTLFTWRQYGWGAGNVNSWVTRYDATAPAPVSLESSFVSWRRDPTDTLVFLDASETRVFNKQQMFSATNVSVLLTQFAENLYGISFDGSLAFGPTMVFNTQTGAAVTNLSFSTTVQTLSGDQKRLFRYKVDVSNLIVYDMATIAPTTGPTIMPTPGDGAVVGLPPTNLMWTVSPVALSYDVYLGTNQAQVAAAGPASAQYLGRVNTPGKPVVLSAEALTYFWRVDVVGFSVTNTGPVWSFTVSPLAVFPGQINRGAIAGYNPQSATLTLTSAVAQSWSAAVKGASWIGLSATSGVSPSSIVVNFNTAALAANIYTNTIEVTVGPLKVQVPVTVDIKPLNILKMATDYQRPYIYALQAPVASGQSGQLLFINTASGNIDTVLPIGINPTDLAVHNGEGRLYIASWTENATYVVDLTSQSLLPVLHLGTDIYKINAGKPGRVITEGEDQWVGVSVVDTIGGTNLSGGSVREGDGETDPTGTVYYHCDNNISDAHITKYQLTNDTLAGVAGSLQHPYGSRNLVLAPDGTRLFWRGFIYDASLNESGNLGEEIYTSTAHGDFAFGSQHVFNARNGQSVYTLPFSTSIMALSGDQQKVFLFNSSSKQLVVIPMSQIASVPDPGLNPTPPNGAVVNLPLSQVSWTASPFALSYRVFIGTNLAAVTAAGTNSPLFLGETSATAFTLINSLNAGVAYYWRVDSVGFSTVTAGTVWSFSTAPLSVSPQSLSIKGVVGLPILPQSITLSATDPIEWTMSIAQSWVTPSITAGTTPSTVTLNFNTAGLTAGFYTNQMSISAKGIVMQLPIVVQLFNLTASRIVPDRNRNYIYVLHPGSGSFDDAFLLFLKTDSGIVEKVIPIGTNPTDLTVNRDEDRLYVSNWQHNLTRVVDLVTQSELSPLSLGTDVYKVNGGAAGRIVIEGEDQWITMSVVNTTNGAILGSGFPREGDGECDPTGHFYYHCDNNISGAGIAKFDISNDSFVSVAGAGGHYYYGSRNIVLSLDGSRLFWTSAVYDANLVDLGVLGAEIYGCSTNGSLAFSDHQAFDTATKQVVYNLPVTSSVMAVDRMDQRLWYFNSSTRRIESLPLQTIRAPTITQQPAGGSVVLGGSMTLSVAASGYGPFSYQWQMVGTNLPGQTTNTLALTNLQSSQEGDYRAIVSNSYGSVTSAIAHISVLIPPTITTQPQRTRVLAGQAFTLAVAASGSAPLSYKWTFEGLTLAGATGTALTISNAQAINEGVYRAVVMNTVGSDTSSAALVRVTPAPPVILSGPASVTVPAASNATFSVSAGGGQPLFYLWLFNGSPIAGATTTQFSITNAQSWHIGNYQAVATNGAGSVTSVVATLNVIPMPPLFVLQPSNATLLPGTNFTLRALARGSEPMSYQWRKDGAALAGATQTALTFSNLSLSASGGYDVLATNSVGSSTSLLASLVVTGSAPVFVQQPASTSALAGATIILNSQATGSAPLQYQWYFQGASLLNQTNRQITLTSLTLGATGPYFAVASNVFGMATSLVAQVTVNQPPFLQQGLTNQIVDAGHTVLLAVAASGSSALSYAWQLNGTPIAGAGAALILTNAQPAQSGYYRVTVSSQFGSISSTGRVTVFGPASWLTAWGDNSGGQTNVPGNLNDLVAVAGGDYHSLALRRDGSLNAWGYNGDGQTAIPTNATRFIAIAAGGGHNLAVTETGSVVGWGRNDAGQRTVPATATSVLAVAAGDSHSLALLSSGTVLAWGDNTFGQGVGSENLVGVRAIATGRNHNLALRNNGTVVGWGYNSFGQATPPKNLSGVAAIAGGYLHSAALLSNMTVVAWGDNSFGQTNVPAGLSNVVAIAAGDFHTLALRANGSVVGWGDNSYGQFEIPATANQALAIASGYYHGLALLPTPVLRYGLTTAGLIVQWDGDFVLQTAPAITGPFSDVPGASGSYTNALRTGRPKFFRLRR